MMMFDLFQAIADRVREQAGEYAQAQARIGTRTLASLADPYGMMSALSARQICTAPAAGTELRPSRPRSERRPRPAKRGKTAKARACKPQRAALNFA